MLKDVDILVTLGLMRRGPGPWTVRALAGELILPPATVQRSLARLAATPVFDQSRRRLSFAACERLLVDVLPFVAPGVLGSETRGMPTAWAASPLKEELANVGPAPVWPDAHGEVRGPEVQPLHPAVVSLAHADSEMYELLALVDAVRLGDARSRSLARERLSAWTRHVEEASAHRAAQGHAS